MLHRIRSLFAALVRRDRFERLMSDEIRFHMDAYVDDLVRGGVSPAEAKRRARIEFGGMEGVKQECREARRLNMVDSLVQDLRYAVRMLTRYPGVASLAVLSLALGIGANAAIFSVVNTIVWRSLPVDHPQEYVAVREVWPKAGNTYNLSYPTYLDYRDRNDVFTGLLAARLDPMSLSRHGETERLWGFLVSANYFDVLGVRPVLGRSFSADEDVGEGAHPVAVLSYRCWQRRFAADPAVVGSTVTLNGHPFVVIGVAPDGFQGTELAFSSEIWVPLMMSGQIEPGNHFLNERREGAMNQVIGRLKPGISAQQASSSLAALAAQLEKEAGAPDGRSVLLSPPGLFAPQLRTVVVRFALVLLCVVGVVLLLACTNIASLLLARAVERRREIAIRLAIGAGRGRLIQLLLTESLVLASLGGILGLGVALGANRLLERLAPKLDFPLAISLHIDARVLTFALALALGTGVLCGLLPALQAARPQLVLALKEDETSYRRSRVRGVLIIAQVTLSLLLLISAGLIVRSLKNAEGMDPGFDPKHTIELSVDLGLQGYDELRGRAFHAEVLSRVTALPGVESASFASHVPLSLDRSTTSVYPSERAAPKPEERIESLWGRVAPEYFATLRIPLLRGREFAAADSAAAPRVAIINETLARRLWPGEDAVGKRLGGFGRPEIVGVARDGSYDALGETPQPFLYIPLQQNYRSAVTLLVRTSQNPSDAIAMVRKGLHEIDPDLPVYDIQTMEEHLNLSLFPARIAASLLGAFSVLAVLLAAVGLYGVMVHLTVQRTREMGIRIALGATPGGVLRLLIGHAVALSLAGVGCGLIAAILLTRLLTSFLYGVSPTDPLVFVSMSGGLLLVTLVASYVPARRVIRCEPLRSLKYE